MSSYAINYNNNVYFVNGTTATTAIIELNKNLGVFSFNFNDYICKEIKKYISVKGDFITIENNRIIEGSPEKITPVKNAVFILSGSRFYNYSAFLDNNNNIILKSDIK